MASSCNDDFPYQVGEIPEGEGIVSATVTFTPTIAANLGKTRTPGNAINDIKSLCVLVYTADGKLFKSYSSKSSEENSKLTYTIGTYKVNQSDDHLDGNEAHTDEEETAKATFSLNNLAYGRYRIYAVANMDDLLEKYGENIQDENGLKNISLNWNPNDVPANNQMFGYFTPATNMDSKGFDAPLLELSTTKTEIHAWLKRAASKVTVKFDPSGLNERVWIYVKSVTVMDLPKTCFLGKENTPDNANQLYNHLDRYGVPDQYKPTIADTEITPNTRFWYNASGVVTNVSGRPDLNNKKSGLELNKSIREAIPKDAHNPSSPSLFFYENNQQPDYTGMSETQKIKYNKEQQHTGLQDGVGKPIRDDENDKDFKDRVKYGTYVEVEAYYISENPEKTGEGPIKYRFMLGKDVTYNYDAQRNYHFKLTLGFKGWANEPDWHIDYEQPEPGIEVPEVFRVSYLYHQKSELPIRILGDCSDLQVDIIENNWAPYDSVGYTYNGNKYEVPAPQPVADESPDATYAFKWNFDAYISDVYMRTENGKKVQVPYFGFLCLHLPDRNTTSIPEDFGASANASLIKYYNDNHEGDRHFTRADLTVGSHGNTSSDVVYTEDDAYNVINVKDDNNHDVPNQKTLLLPLWTRAKTLIEDSGFSGNNPFEGYERKAVVRITAKFPNKPDIVKEVRVLQVRRLVNPKGVWRAYNESNAFNVTLLEADNANGRSGFHPFVSQGEWSAYVDAESNEGGFSLDMNNETNGYKEGNVIHGYTGSTISFSINFSTSVDEDDSKCAIVKVLYHGNQCLHKILIRKGYNNPIELGGNKWSSFALYGANWIRGNNDGYDDEYNATLTLNPLMLGSMFRRGIQSKGIYVKNNQKAALAPFLPPNGASFEVANTRTPSQTWTQINYRNDRNTDRSLGKFYAGGRTYKVPSYDDFMDLTNSCEFGYGVFYGSAATAPATTADDAYGLIDPDNTGEFTDPRGMRGIVAYDRTTGDQIFFPMGKYGTGRRTMFNVQELSNGDPNPNYYGVLRYADVYDVLNGSNDVYRPIPYNLPIACGNIYWIDVYRAGGGPQGSGCLGWDMNYFNFDFNPYTANNYRDACPIKFIVVD